jgi:DNA-binding NarL/FixJ family response regulator
MIRVLIADDHPFVRAAVAALLNSTDDIEVVGECADGTEVEAAVVSVQPDVVLLDVNMPRVSGVEAAASLATTQSSVRVVILSGSIDAGGGPAGAASAGAVGFVLKGNPGELVEVVRSVAAGGTAWPAEFTPAAG